MADLIKNIINDLKGKEPEEYEKIDPELKLINYFQLFFIIIIYNLFLVALVNLILIFN